MQELGQNDKIPNSQYVQDPVPSTLFELGSVPSGRKRVFRSVSPGEDGRSDSSDLGLLGHERTPAGVRWARHRLTARLGSFERSTTAY